MTIKPVFAWYDLWIGAYWDRKARKLYILPLPCVGIVIHFRPQPPVSAAIRAAGEENDGKN